MTAAERNLPSEIIQERDLYRELLELGQHDSIEPFLEKALMLLVQVTGARRGVIHLWEGEERGEPAFSLKRGFGPGEAVGAFSQSVITETFSTGETIVAVSAIDDPRFRETGSVRSNRLEAVLCMPMGRNPIFGVVYLQDRQNPGPFSDDDRIRGETFARHLAAYADRLLLRRRQSADLDATSALRHTMKASGLVGRTPAVAKLLREIALVAPLQVSVLLTGSSGSGKTQAARLIHENGPRATGPFIEVNCGAIPPDLIENELFGAVAGAHATAAKRLPGKVAAAEGGTLFLDEVGELPRRAQASLLQILQSKVYYQLGSSTPTRANVRVVAATNADLERAISEQRFREDLYYRLNVYPIRIPGLAERRPDIPLLAAHFCRHASETHGLTAPELSPGALRAVEAAIWPGEIRELHHAVEAATIRASGEASPFVERRHIFPDETLSADVASETETFHESTRRFQEGLVRQALQHSDGNVTAAARRLSIARAHLYNLIANFGIARS